MGLLNFIKWLYLKLMTPHAIPSGAPLAPSAPLARLAFFLLAIASVGALALSAWSAAPMALCSTPAAAALSPNPNGPASASAA